MFTQQTPKEKNRSPLGLISHVTWSTFSTAKACPGVCGLDSGGFVDSNVARGPSSDCSSAPRQHGCNPIRARAIALAKISFGKSGCSIKPIYHKFYLDRTGPM